MMPDKQARAAGRLSQRISITVAGALLLAALVAFVWSALARRVVRDFAVESVLPPVPTDWISTDLPIAETEIVKDAVDELLNFDSAVYRRYEFDGMSFDLYFSYWSPGKQPPRLVAAHTPDICWVVNGWTVADRTTRPETLSSTIAPLKGHFRVFQQHGRSVSVIFWQIVGDKEAFFSTTLEDAENRGVLAEIRSRGLFSRAEAQYFVRLSSVHTWSELRANAQFMVYLRLLADCRPPKI